MQCKARGEWAAPLPGQVKRWGCPGGGARRSPSPWLCWSGGGDGEREGGARPSASCTGAFARGPSPPRKPLPPAFPPPAPQVSSASRKVQLVVCSPPCSFLIPEGIVVDCTFLVYDLVQSRVWEMARFSIYIQKLVCNFGSSFFWWPLAYHQSGLWCLLDTWFRIKAGNTSLRGSNSTLGCLCHWVMVASRVYRPPFFPMGTRFILNDSAMSLDQGQPVSSHDRVGIRTWVFQTRSQRSIH